jgi:N-ethylmaleimide reductase
VFKSIHAWNAGMTVDKETIDTHEYIVNKLNEYGLAYSTFNGAFTDVSEVPYAVSEVAKHFRPFIQRIIIKALLKKLVIK